MTQDEIIRMAREAGFVFPETQEDSFTCWWEELERFAVIIAAHKREKQAEQEPVADEREACAKVCEELVKGFNEEADNSRLWCAAAIRARGEKC